MRYFLDLIQTVQKIKLPSELNIDRPRHCGVFNLVATQIIQIAAVVVIVGVSHCVAGTAVEAAGRGLPPGPDRFHYIQEQVRVADGLHVGAILLKQLRLNNVLDLLGYIIHLIRLKQPIMLFNFKYQKLKIKF